MRTNIIVQKNHIFPNLLFYKGFLRTLIFCQQPHVLTMVFFETRTDEERESAQSDEEGRRCPMVTALWK